VSWEKKTTMAALTSQRLATWRLQRVLADSVATAGL
jgi:hypothetical protein